MPKRYVGDTLHDQHGGLVQVLPPNATRHTRVTVDGTSRSAAIGSAKVLRVAANVDCFYSFGSSGVTASSADQYFCAGAETIAVPDGATHIALVQNGMAGFATVTGLGRA